RDAINSAGGSVTASIVSAGAGSTPYRLVLSANTPGASNAITITNNNTTLDFTNKKIENAYAATTNSYAGTASSNAGTAYTGTTNKTFLAKIVTGGAAGVATYKYSIDGGITYLGANGATYNGSNAITTQGTLTNYIDSAVASNSTNEGVQIAFGAGTLAADDSFTVNVYNPTMQAAQDAVVKIDNTTVTRSSNTITDAIQGVTMNLTQVDTSNAVTLSVATDTSGLSEKIKNFVNSYNDVNAFLADQLKYDPKTKKGGTLLSDSSIRTVQALLRNVISNGIPGLTTGKMNLSQIGITSDSKTGTLKVNDATLSAAISSDPDGIKRLFLGIGTPSNSAIAFNSLTAKTGAGTYGIALTIAPQKAGLGGSSDATMQNISSTGLTSAEVLSFTYSSNYTETSPATTSFAVTLTAGSKINDVVSVLNSAFATQKVGLSASNDNSSGKLKITSTDYGKDIRFTVISDQGGVTQTGIGTTIRTAQGVNIAGTINDHSATGKGKVLTSSSGFAEDGLSISSETTTTGLFGTIAVSRGVGDQLVAKLGGYTDPKSGIFATKTTGLQASIDRLSESIKKINAQATNEGERLRKQLIRLESVMAQFQASSNYLTNQLSKLPSYSTK
ncbi:MAG: flagellar filament capping protein FliD, partial [Nitrospirae bacterium]|nr:flagellar filament capping protein FliD [Nitrospirota bacterium]